MSSRADVRARGKRFYAARRVRRRQRALLPPAHEPQRRTLSDDGENGGRIAFPIDADSRNVRHYDVRIPFDRAFCDLRLGPTGPAERYFRRRRQHVRAYTVWMLYDSDVRPIRREDKPVVKPLVAVDRNVEYVSWKQNKTKRNGRVREKTAAQIDFLHCSAQYKKFTSLPVFFFFKQFVLIPFFSSKNDTKF